MNPFRTPLDPPPKAPPLRFRAPQRPDLTTAQILQWCDAFHTRWGRWPTRNDGARGLPDTTWSAINTCLTHGLRGLPGGSSLAKLLLKQRGRRHKGCLPRLTTTRILMWADDHHARTGEWPTQHTGPVTIASGETWSGVNVALMVGGRGLPGGSSLAQLLSARRGARNHMALPPLTLTQILQWADAHHARSGQWPHRDSGAITGALTESWSAVNSALNKGLRGLPGSRSLAQLLQSQRGVRNVAALPSLQLREILVWADAHHNRTGRWPTAKSGVIPEASDETWSKVDSALGTGLRGLPGGDSLARLLHRRRGVPNIQSRPRLSIQRILQWAQAYRQRNGQWPKRESGAIPESSGDTWKTINNALKRGSRGLSGDSSLPRLLEAKCGVRNRAAVSRLTHEEILVWADAHHNRTGGWPTSVSGPIRSARGETWSGVNAALHKGLRGLPGGSSLAQLLAQERGKRNHLALPPLTVRQILAWADAYQTRTGAWPVIKSGAIPEATGQTWEAVNMALTVGVRGLPGGDSLARLLTRCRGVRNRNAPPALSLEQIQRWVRAHYRQTGCWPKPGDGAIASVPGETWLAVATALSRGLRSLPGGSSLAQVVGQCRTSRSRS